jgi:hypothetical protein
MRIEGEVGVTRDGEAVYRQSVEQLGRLYLRRRDARCANLGEAVRDEEDEHDEGPVRRALDLKVAEERVGAEEVDRLVYDVACFWVGYLRYELRR